MSETVYAIPLMTDRARETENKKEPKQHEKQKKSQTPVIFNEKGKKEGKKKNPQPTPLGHPNHSKTCNRGHECSVASQLTGTGGVLKSGRLNLVKKWSF